MHNHFQNLLKPGCAGRFLELSVCLKQNYSKALSSLFHFDEMGDAEFQMGKINSVLDAFVEDALEKRLCRIIYDVDGNVQNQLYILCPITEAESFLAFLDQQDLKRFQDNQIGWFSWEHRGFVFKDLSTQIRLMIVAGLNYQLGECPELGRDLQYSGALGEDMAFMERELQVLSDGLGKPLSFSYNGGAVEINVSPSLG